MSLIQNFLIDNNNQATFDVVINNNEYLALVAKYEAEYLKTVAVDGFRPGHVPKEVAMKNVNPIAFESFIIEKVINTNSELVYKEAQEELKKEGRSMLRINIDESEGKGIDKNEAGDFIYYCIAKLLPKVDLKAITSCKPKAVDASEFIAFDKYQEMQIGSFLKEMNEYEVVEGREAQKGDKVTLSFNGTLDGVSMPSLNSESYTVMLGSKEFLEDFEAALYGMKENDTKTFEVTFPKDYFSAEMQGKTVEFTANIKGIEVAKFSSIKEVIESSEDKREDLVSEDHVLGYIKSRYEDEKSNFVSSKTKESFMEFLVKETPNFEISAEEVDKQTESIFSSLVEGAKESGSKIGEIFLQSGLRTDNKNIVNLDNLQVRAEVEKNVREELKLQYIYLTVIYTQELKQPEAKMIEEYTTQITANPRMYGFPENLKKEELHEMLIDRMMKSEAFNWLVENTGKAE